MTVKTRLHTCTPPHRQQIQNEKQLLTAPYNNMRTLTFKAQPTNAFFATANQTFGGSS